MTREAPSPELVAPWTPPTAVVDHQVLQRTHPAGVQVALGTSREISVLDGSGGTVARAGSADHLDIPVGGPYTFVQSGADGTAQTLADDVYVGDVWVLAGQSNMAGGGAMRDLEEPLDSVHLFDLVGGWRLATEPLHGFVGEPTGSRGAGLGLTFAKTYVGRTRVPVGMLPTAVGGAAMADWSPDLPAVDSELPLYQAMLRAVAAAGGSVAGVLWYQGESEAIGKTPAALPRSGYSRATKQTAQSFAATLRSFVRRVRADLGNPDLPFFHVQVGRFVDEAEPAFVDAWNIVRDVQRRYDEVEVTGAVTAIDLPLWDLVHLETEGLRRVGRRLGRLASGEAESLRVVSVDVRGVGLPSVVRVRYAGVTGALQPQAHIGGFSVRDEAGRAQPVVATADVDPQDPTAVLLRLTTPLQPGDALWYGWGTDPYCNLVDSADMAAPAFGPWPLLPRT